jgi:hypothetical protein
MTFTGDLATWNGTPSVIEIQIPRPILENPAFLNTGVVNAGRGQIHTASDILGTNTSAKDCEETIVLDVFAHYPITDGP